MWNYLIGWGVVLFTLPLIYAIGIPMAWLLDGRQFLNTSVGMRFLAGCVGVGIIFLIVVGVYMINSGMDDVGRALTGGGV